MLAVQRQQLYELRKKAGLIKGKKTPESIRALEARLAMLEAKTNNSSNESFFADIKPKANNRNNPALDRKGNGTRQSQWLGPMIGTVSDSQPSVLRNSYIQPLTTVQVMVAHVSVVSSKLKVELDSHADMCVVGDDCSVVHDHNRPVNTYSYDPKDGYRSAKTVDAAQWSKVYFNDKSSYSNRWTSQPSFMPHAVSSEWGAYQ